MRLGGEWLAGGGGGAKGGAEGLLVAHMAMGVCVLSAVSVWTGGGGCPELRVLGRMFLWSFLISDMEWVPLCCSFWNSTACR